MSSKWSETGILRKRQTKENFDDLLVFGYACKLFRDNERALYIDQGKHLIPWMGDERLKIDRYDGRGALSSLSNYESSREGYDAMRWLGLSENEHKLEQLCDEERYYSLLNNEDEDIMYKEEESKRQKANEFQYNYNVSANSETHSNEIIATCEEEDRLFVPAKELDVPVDIDIPKTVKENARIEKTALFVSQQGPQMEILIKAKQKDNPQFGFMNHNDPLHKYYRHLLNAIKSGQYQPEKEALAENNDTAIPNANVSDTNENEHYLHPILSMTANIPTKQTILPMPKAPTIHYKPAADCAYTQLVSRIKGNSIEKSLSTTQEATLTNDSSQQLQGDLSDQYYQYYQAYYQYYRQIAQQYAVQGNCEINAILQNSQLQEQIQQQAVQYAQAACAHFTAAQSHISAVLSQPTAKPNNVAKVVVTPAVPENPVSTNKLEHKVSLVHYSSDSSDNYEEEEELDEKSTFIIPSTDIALIVDKMATYVSKNGPDFENSVKEKGDPRFDFLHDSHKYHKYYKYKVNEFSVKCNGTANKESQEIVYKTIEINLDAKGDISMEEETTEKKVLAPVSFSIKKSKEDSSKDIKSALPIEESDEEIATILEQPSPPVPTMVPPPELTPTIISSCSPVPTIPVEEPLNGRKFDDPIFEMIDLTEETPDMKKIADERFKDKLASVVRERALQMDRKKRAALFLRMQSASGNKAVSKENDDEKYDEKSLVPISEDVSLSPESELEEGEIKPMVKHKETNKKSKHKRSKSRNSYSESKSRHRKHKKRKSSSPASSPAISSDTE